MGNILYIMSIILGEKMNVITAQLTDLVEAINMIKSAKSADLSGWEAIVMIMFIVKDLLIIGGILGTIIWFIKKRNNDTRTTEKQ
tara:strand:- start:163 stop:417 length:255 start_codon:yes stop_codon:yes gene_type:complete